MKRGIWSLDFSFRRRSLVGYSVGLAVYMLIIVALYPAFKDASNLNDMVDKASTMSALFGISGSITSPTGWISANAYTNFFPLIVLMLTIGFGAWCVAGQEGDGHLELVMSAPYSRRRVVTEKMLGLVSQAIVVSTVVMVCVMAGRAFDLSIDPAHLATATLAIALLGIDFGLLALTIGSATGSRGTALGVSSGVAAAMYLANTLAPVITWLEPARYASLFYWSVGDSQLDQGLSLTALAVLGGVGVIVAMAAVRAFETHDLT